MLTLLLLTHFLSRSQQGFYFQFSDILSLQIFFELGLAHVLVQFASHEYAQLKWTSVGTVEGDLTSKVRLASLLLVIVKWYGTITVLLILLLLPGGSIFFLRYGVDYPGIGWQVPWFWIVLVTAGSLAVSPLLAVLEGCGLIARLARLQLILGMIGSLLSRNCALAVADETALFYGFVVDIGTSLFFHSHHKRNAHN